MKKYLSSRSRSRSRSPPHNRERERNYPRVYQNREFRGYNRGYRRPFFNRGRGRGFHQRGQYNRGGYGNYRSNWQNYRPYYGPRRPRSRSRSPKRRSVTPRSRSCSRNSDRSSSGRSRSSSSGSSSHHSRSGSSKRRSVKQHNAAQKEARASLPPAQVSQGAESKAKPPADATSNDSKDPEAISKPWKGLTAYDSSPKHPSSVVHSVNASGLNSPPHPSPIQKSPLQSVAVKRSPPQKSPQSHSPAGPSSLRQSPVPPIPPLRTVPRQSPQAHSPKRSSPAERSPVRKSPPIISTSYNNAQKEESRAGESTSPLVSSYLKRYLEEQKNKATTQDRENGREKDQKAKNEEREKVKERSGVSEMGVPFFKSDYLAPKNESESLYRGIPSPRRYRYSNELEKSMSAEFQEEALHSMDMQESEKKHRVKGLKDSKLEDEPKCKSKVIVPSTAKNQDTYEERLSKWEELAYFPSAKEKSWEDEDMEDEVYPGRAKREEVKRAELGGYRGPIPDKNPRSGSYKVVHERSPSPPPRRSAEGKEREKMATKEENPPISKTTFSVYRGSEINVRMDALEDDFGSSVAHERRLSRDLVHGNKKDLGFRSIFQHIQSSQSRRSPSELFAQHIVTIVHHVKEHHFESPEMTLSERFTMYQRRAMEQGAARSKKSPEFHRRIDISPSAFRKHPFLQDEMKGSRESSSYKGEGKYKEDPVDLRLDIERRKKYKERDHKRDGSRESVDSRDSSQSRERSTEKAQREHKESKKRKKQKKIRSRSKSSSTSSHSSQSYKGGECPEEGDERGEGASGFDKSRLGMREYPSTGERSRGRGPFFRGKGRGWPRVMYPGNASSDFQRRNRDEEWDPEYTPKSKKYYLHDDREGEGGEKWANRGRGRGQFQRGRGRFLYRKSSDSPKWTHDKYKGSGEEGELEDDDSEIEEKEEMKINNNVSTEQ
ncbi:thyroid hormone receptor-associated protein 3 isoform X2 [Latimeria chalumnae]|uniref:thyroid hormone receptor-associated protein 3 isoform X2 n=1 Tax=Latimeria chalumnae TaxID=7897 RepID=UPI0006D94151|nr:PREDICTED: thyroid hormone receptor-associated protein 3 isoform X2 [Latimeria chalumnae]|eukprot:XP_014352819.1 PREDICTED: thyroid hormone receptor-associated protein 3 isoform X2 [Latimeria chalumnae]